MTDSNFPRGKQLQVVEQISLTNVGRIRKNNEDTVGDPRTMAYLFRDLAPVLALKGRLYAVADGMGGLAKGEVASKLALETLFRTYYTSAGEPLETLTRGVEEANKAVFRLGTGTRTNTGQSAATSGSSSPSEDADDSSSVRSELGTTLVAALFLGQKLVVCNVGDSRAYLFRARQLSHLTQDHSMMAEGIRLGFFTEEQAKRSPFKNVVTRAIGQQAEVKADYFEHSVLAGDVVLLCSDGLYGRVSDETIEELLKIHPLDTAARLLIEKANNSGGPDNISVVLVRVGNPAIL